jgi:hypothetical protein
VLHRSKEEAAAFDSLQLNLGPARAAAISVSISRSATLAMKSQVRYRDDVVGSAAEFIRIRTLLRFVAPVGAVTALFQVTNPPRPYALCFYPCLTWTHSAR